jgi:hypothetical protein
MHRQIEVTALLVLTACGQPDRSSPAIAERDSAGITIVENNLERPAETCSIGRKPSLVIGGVEGDEQQQLYRVFGAARLGNDRIALVNDGSKEVRIYDRQGQLRTRMGREGGGPGEFQNAFYFSVLPGDTLWVANYPPFEFVIFSADGKFVRTVRPQPHSYLPEDFPVLDDGRFVLTHREDMFRQTPLGVYSPRTVTLVLHDRNGVLIDTIGTYANGQWARLQGNQLMTRLFEASPQIHAMGARVLIGHGSQPELRILNGSPALTVNRVIRWTTGDRTVTAEVVRAERERKEKLYRDHPPAARAKELEAEFGKARPVAEKLPAFAGAMFGRDGRIWVRESRTPSPDRTYRWIAFDSTGRFQCRATIPAFEVLLEFGRDHVLGLERDELLGVERVLEYPLNPR